MRNPTDLPPELVDLAAAAQRSLEAGEFAAASELLAQCLSACETSERRVDELHRYRDWLTGCLSLAQISRKHLSHQAIQLRQSNYGRADSTSLWSVQA